MNAETVIEIRNATVEYRVQEFQVSTFKEYALRKLKGVHKVKTFKALDSVRLEVRRGESVALLGHNGSGKSTLLRVVAGIIEPREAKVNVTGRIAPLIELGAGFDVELTGRENIRLSCMLMGLKGYEIDARMDRIIEYSELAGFIDMPIKNYSSGMFGRLGFACATAVDPEVLLIDEVMSVGDANFSKKSRARLDELRAGGATVVLVSHSMPTVRDFCDRGVVLCEGKVVFDGPVEAAIAEHEKIMASRLG